MFKYRAEITKDEEVRYISHLDYAALIERAICRAKLPAAYSEGFNPHMKLAFASALAVGVISEAEYMDFELKEELAVEEVEARLSQSLPGGVRLKRLRLLAVKAKALMSEADLAFYQITVPLLGEKESAVKAVTSFNEAEEIIYKRVTPKKTREIEVKQYLKRKLVLDIKEQTANIMMQIIVTPTGSIKPGEVLKILQEQFGFPIDAAAALISREKLYGQGKPLIELD